MVTPRHLLYTTRKSQNLSRREVAEGICAASTIAQYELGHLTPTDKMLDLLCPRLGIERAYMALVVAVHRKIMKDLSHACKMGDYNTAGRLFAELARREQMPSVAERYAETALSCMRIMLRVD